MIVRKLLVNAAQDEIHRLHELEQITIEDFDFLKTYFKTRYRIFEILTPIGNKIHRLEEARQKILSAQRQLLLEMWERGELDDQMLVSLEYEIDVESVVVARAEI